MPKIINSIDRIARMKDRDALFVTFSEGAGASSRKKLLQWLDQYGVTHQECFDYWRDGLAVMAYTGTIYLDLAHNLADPLYLMVQSHFENKDGTMKIPGVTFCLLTLAAAMNNAHHDAAGYWGDV
jgi:agmatine/peptidylarginine deiminase